MGTDLSFVPSLRRALSCVVLLATLAAGAVPAGAAPAPALESVSFAMDPARLVLTAAAGNAASLVAGFADAQASRLVLPLQAIGLGPYRADRLYPARVAWASGFRLVPDGGEIDLVVVLRRPLRVVREDNAHGRRLVVELGAAPSERAFAKDLFGVMAVRPATVPSLRPRGSRRAVRVEALSATYAVTVVRRALPAEVRMRLPADMRQVVAYALRLYGSDTLYLAAPQGAHASGRVAADGSYGLTIRSGAQALSVSSSGACLGCALGRAGPFFAALARLELRTYRLGTGQDAVPTLAPLVAHAYPARRVFVFAFHAVDGDVVEGFVAAPMTYDTPGGLAYGATWSGPGRDRRVGTVELEAAFATLSR